jgi:presenilin-like A22 family membrane protease
VKASELRSLRLITFFLIAFFIYDIVMVFGTRLLTSNGCSVMVQVVTGMDCTKTRTIDHFKQVCRFNSIVPFSDWPVAPVVAGMTRPQKIPLLFYVPILSNPIGHCFDPLVEGEYQNMMLGLGDVIAPGYLIAFAFYLDVRKMNRYYL